MDEPPPHRSANSGEPPNNSPGVPETPQAEPHRERRSNPERHFAEPKSLRETSYLGGDKITKELEEIKDRHKEWAESKGFDRPTLSEEAERVREQWAIDKGEFPTLPEFKFQSANKVSLFSDATGNRQREYQYHLTKLDFPSSDFVDLMTIAVEHGFVITSSIGGTHTKNSFHYVGKAVDLRTRGKSRAQIDAFISYARGLGVRVRDETKKENWVRETSGPHLHLDTGTQREIDERRRSRSSERSNSRRDKPLRVPKVEIRRP